MQSWRDIWILGMIMNSLITHKNKAKKYVYDGTICVVGTTGKELDANTFQTESM